MNIILLSQNIDRGTYCWRDILGANLGPKHYISMIGAFMIILKIKFLEIG